MSILSGTVCSFHSNVKKLESRKIILLLSKFEVKIFIRIAGIVPWVGQ
jgi:hypothetical protein